MLVAACHCDTRRLIQIVKGRGIDVENPRVKQCSETGRMPAAFKRSSINVHGARKVRRNVSARHSPHLKNENIAVTHFAIAALSAPLNAPPVVRLRSGCWNCAIVRVQVGLREVNEALQNMLYAIRATILAIVRELPTPSNLHTFTLAAACD
jgi:hypothetical protein